MFPGEVPQPGQLHARHIPTGFPPDHLRERKRRALGTELRDEVFLDG